MEGDVYESLDILLLLLGLWGAALLLRWLNSGVSRLPLKTTHETRL